MPHFPLLPPLATSEAAATAIADEETAELLRGQMHDLVQTLGPEHILLIGAVGVISLTLGWRFYFALAILMCAGVGFLIGDALAAATHTQVTESNWYPIVLPVVGAVAFGAIAIPYLRAGIFAISGVIGGYSGYIASLYIAPGMSLFFTVFGFVVVGLVSMAFFQLMVVIGTSILGSAALVLCGTWALYTYSPDNYAWLLERQGLLPLAALVATFIGVAIQLQMVPEGGLKAHYESHRKPRPKDRAPTKQQATSETTEIHRDSPQ